MAFIYDTILAPGLAADRPAAADVGAGALYYSTDTEVTERSDGSTWETYSGTGGGGGITALTGDVTASGSGSVAATIANTAVSAAKLASDAVTTGKILDANVTNAKLADMVASTIKGRISTTGAPQDLTATQATAVLNAMVGDSGSGGTKGLVPAPGSGDAAAGKYLKADGTFAVPPGTGGASGLVWLGKQVASSSATLDFTSLMSATYDEYMVEFSECVAASGSQEMIMRVSTNNGSSWDAGGTSYVWSGIFFRVSTSNANGSAASGDDEIHLSAGVTMNNTAAEGGLSGTLKIFGANSSTRWKHMVGQLFAAGSDTNYYGIGLGAAYRSTTAINALRFLMTSGNIASGEIHLYGVAKA